MGPPRGRPRGSNTTRTGRRETGPRGRCAEGCHRTGRSSGKQRFKELAHHGEAIASGLHIQDTACVKCGPAIGILGVEVRAQALPVADVPILQQANEALALAAGGLLFQRQFPQRGTPPAEFVVGIVSEHTRVASVRCHLLTGLVLHPLDDDGIPEVPPRRARSAAHVEDRGHPGCGAVCRGAILRGAQRRMIRPGTQGVESPTPQAAQRDFGPCVRSGMHLPRGIARILGIVVPAVVPARHHAHADTEERFGIGTDPPPAVGALLNPGRPGRRGFTEAAADHHGQHPESSEWTNPDHAHGSRGKQVTR